MTNKWKKWYIKIDSKLFMCLLFINDLFLDPFNYKFIKTLIFLKLLSYLSTLQKINITFNIISSNICLGKAENIIPSHICLRKVGTNCAAV